MNLKDYQERTQKTAKVFKPRAFELNDLRGLIAVMEAAVSTTDVAGVLKKNIFHGHQKPFDWRCVASMYEYASSVRSGEKTVKVVGTSNLLQVPELAIIDGILGMVDEVGEVAELVIPVLKGEKTAAEISEKLHDELGDVMWYIARTAESAGISMASVAQGNLAKLEARYPSGFDPNASQHRDLGAEDQARHDAGKNNTNKEELLIKAITEMKLALDSTIMDNGQVALKGEPDKVDLLQKAYDNINKTLEEVYND